MAPLRVALFQYVLPHYRRAFFDRLKREAASEAKIELVIVPRRSLGQSLSAVWRERGAGLWISSLEIGFAANAWIWLARRLGLYRGRHILWGCGYEKPARPLVRRIADALYRELIRSADLVICYSEHARQYYQRLVPEQRYRVAANSIDEREITQATSSLTPEQVARARARLGEPRPHTLTLLTIGTLQAGKDYDFLIECLADPSLRGRVELLVIGDGPLAASLQAQARDAAVHVHWLGRLEAKRDIAPYAALAHAFVLPGLGGLAINEAFAFGLPVLTSPADGSAYQLIDEGANGHIIARHDRAAWIGRIRELVELVEHNPAALQAMGEHARRTIRDRINLATYTSQYLGALREGLGAAPAARS